MAGSLAEQAYRQLEQRVVTLRLRPGAVLQEQALADSLGLGRTPVREAVQRLAAAGMLSVLPRKGVVVTRMDRRALRRVVETRRVLERLLAAKAAERAGRSQRAELRALARQLDSGAGEALRFYRLVRQLDECLASSCDNPFLAQALVPLHLHCRRLWFRFRRTTDLTEMSRWHARAAGCVADGDRTGAIRSVNGIIGMLERLLEELDDMT